jgi:mono/diheme cytochrome c family protein
MKNIKVIIALHVIFMALIIAAFLPALNVSNEGYNTKTAGVISTQQTQVMTEEVATELVNEPAPTTVAEVDKISEPASSVTMIEETIKQVIAAKDSAVNEPISTADSIVEVVETVVIIEPTVTTVETSVIVEPSVAPVETVAIITGPTNTVIETSTAAVARDVLYNVVDGNKLDAHSYAGFKLYRNWCARCHGTYGQGMVGPNLADSLKYINKDQFYETVEKGKSGTIGSMPAWRKNVKVMAGRDKLYAYLMARSDGAIGMEKPKKQ